VRQIQRPQDQAVEHREHHRIRPDRQRQRKNCGYGEPRRLCQRAQAEPQVAKERFERRKTHRLVRFCPIALVSAELDVGAALGLGARQS
jgi:hypothetical protein